MDCSPHGSSVHGIRQEYWSGLQYPPLGDLPDPGIEPRSPTWQVDSLPSEPPGKPESTKLASNTSLWTLGWESFLFLSQLCGRCSVIHSVSCIIRLFIYHCSTIQEVLWGQQEPSLPQTSEHFQTPAFCLASCRPSVNNLLNWTDCSDNRFFFFFFFFFFFLPKVGFVSEKYLIDDPYSLLKHFQFELNFPVTKKTLVPMLSYELHINQDCV